MGRAEAVEEMVEMMEEEESKILVTGAEYASSSCCRAFGRWETSSNCFFSLVSLSLLESTSSNAFAIFSCRKTSGAGNRVVETFVRGI